MVTKTVRAPSAERNPYIEIDPRTARTLADTGRRTAPEDEDRCRIYTIGDAAVIAASGAWGVATALQHPIADQHTVYVLWGRRYVYTGETQSMRQRGVDRLLHGNNVVAICHPSLRDNSNRLWMERIAHAAAAAAGVITPFQEEPAGGAWPGDETYHGLVVLWDSVVPVMREFTGLHLPWLGPMPLVRAKLSHDVPIVRRVSWSLRDKIVWATVHADGAYVIDAPSRRLRAPREYHPGSTLELVACGALSLDEAGLPTVIEEPVGFRDLRQASWWVTGQYGCTPHGPPVAENRDAVRRMIAARQAGWEAVMEKRRRERCHW